MTGSAIPLELVHTEGPPLRSSRWRLAPPFRIGRAPDNALVLPDPRVSRRHAVIEACEGAWQVRDCGSRLGTEINELPIAAEGAALHAGDVVGVGPWRFRAQAASRPDHVGTLGDVPARVSVVRSLGNLAEQRLELLLRCADEVTAAADEQTLADAVVESALLGSGYARAAWLVDGEAGFEVRSLRPVARADRLRVSHALLESARRGEIARLDSGSGRAPETSAAAHRALCAPVLLDGRADAFLYLDSERSSSKRHPDAPTFCHALVRLAALALANLRRIASEREHAALAADLERARGVQARLLPARQGCLRGLEYALHLHPGRIVAGDIVDVFPLEDGRVVAMLGDVSGAGLGAGLDMVAVQSFLRAQFAHDADPAHAAASLNAHLYARAGGGRFVTLWLGVFDRDAGECRFVDAGHGHALRVTHAAATPLAAGGDIPLGIEARVDFHAERLAFAAGDLLLLYSDGAVEQESPQGESFGLEALVEAVRGADHPSRAIERMLTALRDHTAGAPPDDDTTLLALAWTDSEV